MTVHLRIGGKEVEAERGIPILEAALRNDIYIPHLCYLQGLSPYGGCRVCAVEIEGSSKIFASCTTPVAEGLNVIIDSPRIREYRKMAVELLMSERAHICSVCVANGNCELQDLAKELGVEHVEFERGWPRFEVDTSHSNLVIDRNRCILCTRCIRVCSEIEGVHTLDLKMRGKDSQVIIDLDDEWKDSPSCTSCGKCAKVCPVGAIYIEGEPLEKTKDKEVAEFVLGRREMANE